MRLLKKYLRTLIRLGLPFIALVMIFWNQPIYRYYEIDGKNKVQGVRIVFLTDLHNSQYGEKQEKLLKMIDDAEPDFILLGGDMIDEKSSSKPSLDFIEALAKNYTVYSVSGNHEHWLGNKKEVFEQMRSYNVHIIDHSVTSVQIGDQTIEITGLRDPERQFGANNKSILKKQLDSLDPLRDKEDFQLLLSHRPEQIHLYEAYAYDLVLSGHAHGGQVRIPYLLNGLYAPNQGLFPMFAGGYYQMSDKLDFIVSRGLSFKAYLPRIMNPPEVLVIDIG